MHRVGALPLTPGQPTATASLICGSLGDRAAVAAFQDRRTRAPDPSIDPAGGELNQEARLCIRSQAALGESIPPHADQRQGRAGGARSRAGPPGPGAAVGAPPQSLPLPRQALRPVWVSPAVLPGPSLSMPGVHCDHPGPGLPGRPGGRWCRSRRPPVGRRSSPTSSGGPGREPAQPFRPARRS